VIVVLDSCQSGFTGNQGLTTNDDAAAAMLSGAHAPMLVLAASKGRQEAQEDKKWGGGLFTYALTEIVRSKRRDHDLDGDGAIEVSELYKGLRSIVIRESKGEQTPWLARQDLIGDFALF
jgi:Caspase domain